MIDDGTPTPLVPADIDLRDFPYMPLDVAQLRKSKAWLLAKKNPEIGFYMMNLWTMSWHEVPAGSLEDDDDVLADIAMCTLAKWRKVREVVLRGWIKCTDGRLYHKIVATKALEAWAAKVAQRTRTAAATAAREERRRELEKQRNVERNGERNDARDDNVTLTLRSPREVEGKGREVDLRPRVASQPVRLAPDDPPPEVEKSKGNGHDDGKARRTAQLNADAREVLEFLNEKTGKKYPPTVSNIGLVVARFREGFTPTQVRQVIASRVRKWKGDERMSEFLRPETLFGRQKFSSYVGELVDVPDDDSQP